MRQSHFPAAHWIARLAAEAGWITVVYSAAVVTFDRRPPALGPIDFAALVGIGALIGRYARPRPEAGTVVVIAAAIGAGALGWLASVEARSIMSDDLGRALGFHGAGWLSALAVLRGAIIRQGSTGASQTQGLLRNALPMVGLLWALGTLVAPAPLRPALTVSAMWGTVVLISAGLLALGLGRLATLHAELRDRQQRRRWRWLVVGAGLAVAPLALPFAALSGIPLGTLLNPIAGPAQVVVGLLAIPLGLFVELMVALLRPVLAPFGPFLDLLAARSEDVAPAQEVEPPVLLTLLGVFLALLTVLVLLALVFLFVNWLLLRREREDPFDSQAPDGDERMILVPGTARRPGSAGNRRGRRPVHDAVTAYLNALVELDGHAPFARHPSETPAQHAARTKAAGMPASDQLARLAAAYQLARYGGRVLTKSEDRRAISRFERIRRSLRVLLRR